jgi:hypothetical protein
VTTGKKRAFQVEEMHVVPYSNANGDASDASAEDSS